MKRFLTALFATTFLMSAALPALAAGAGSDTLGKTKRAVKLTVDPQSHGMMGHKMAPPKASHFSAAPGKRQMANAPSKKSQVKGHGFSASKIVDLKGKSKGSNP